MTDTPPPNASTGRQPVDTGLLNAAAHPNRTLTAPATQCPTIDPSWRTPTECRSPLHLRRTPPTKCLSCSSVNWSVRLYIGATMVRRPRGGRGAVGKCGATQWRCCLLRYHMGDYFRHGSACSIISPLRRGLPCNWFSAKVRRQVSLAMATARICVCSSGWRPCPRPSPVMRLPIGWIPRYNDVHWRDLTFP